MDLRQSSKLASVAYDVRGPVLEEANRLEQGGHRILKLNIGNPAPFGFEAPDDIVAAIVRNLPNAAGYSDSKGLFSARTAVAQYYIAQGIHDVDVDDIYLGNGVSELIAMALQALLNTGDEILSRPRTTRSGPPWRPWPAAVPCTTCATRERSGCPTSPTSSPRSPPTPRPWW